MTTDFLQLYLDKLIPSEKTLVRIKASVLQQAEQPESPSDKMNRIFSSAFAATNRRNTQIFDTTFSATEQQMLQSPAWIAAFGE